ncbi:MAG: tetratricopeptide repeat protein [Acidobacteriota bacterium]
MSDQTTLVDDGAPGSSRAVAASPEASQDDPELGRRIGPYRVERLIARGGMGRVYLATREDDYAQRVALKLIDREVETLGRIDRFYRERQILAQLEHPGIARILDGGTTFDGHPFFVMEYVDGEPVDQYCERRDLDLRARLELVREICRIVQFSHQNLVIHQDLKPGNILVTAEGRPKLLDFGIAELLQSDASSDQGRRGERALTPGYASPEQFFGEPLTTASDVYSLGVLLYRLVSGAAPYDFEGLDAQEVAARVALGDVLPPSRVALPEQRRALAGDVDAIVAKAIAKKPERRYASAAQLAEDLRRHLEDLPIEADPGPWHRQVRKAMRRHKLALAIAVLVVGFTIATTVFWRQAVHRGEVAERARLEAEESRVEALRSQQRAERVSGFLEELFRSGDPDAGAQSVEEVLDRGRLRLLDELEDDPEIRADLLSTLGTVYNNLSLYDEARALKEEALSDRLAADSSDRNELAIAINNVGRLLYDLGDYPAAEEHFRRAVAMWRRLGDEPGVVLGQRNLASLLVTAGRPDEALALHGSIVESQRRLYGARDPAVAESLYSLAILRRSLRMPGEAESLLRQALEIFEEAHGPRHTRVAAVLSSRGRVLHELGRSAEGLQSFERALALRLELLGNEHVHVAHTRKNLAALLLDQGEIARAGRLLEQALVTLRSKKPADDWTRADAESLWGRYLAERGRYEDAEPVLLGAYRTLRAAKGDDDLATRSAHARLVALYEAVGRIHEVPTVALGR